MLGITSAPIFWRRFFLLCQLFFVSLPPLIKVIMKISCSALAALMMLCSLAGCKKKVESTDIIAKKPVIVKPVGTKKMGDYSQSHKIEWLGSTYTVGIRFAADTSLPTVLDGNQKYYDNKITLRITRKDGSEFFNRTFTKGDFAAYIGENYKKNGALTGIVYDRTEGDVLFFAASVGSPDKSSDDFIPLVLKLSRFGEVSISKDTQLDTGGSAAEGGSEIDAAEAEGM